MKTLLLVILTTISVSAKSQSYFDVELQKFVHQKLIDVAFDKSDVEAAAVLVQKTKTGEIICSKALNRREEELVETDVSTFEIPGCVVAKPILLFAMASKTNIDSLFVETGNGLLELDEYTIVDFPAYRYGGYGCLSVMSAFLLNSNIGILKGCQRAFNMSMREYGNAMSRVGIIEGDNPSSYDCLLEDRPFNGYEILGNRTYMSMYEIIAWFSAVAYSSNLLLILQDDDSRVPFRTIKDRNNLPLLRNALRKHVTEGLSHQAMSKKVEIAGFSDVSGEDVDRDRICLFAGYASPDNPQYTVVVAIKEHHRGGTYLPCKIGREILEKLYLTTTNMKTSACFLGNKDSYQPHRAEKGR